MEKEVEVEPFGVVYICDECQIGELGPTGNNSYMPEIKIELRCSNCGDLQYFKENYPLIKFRIK